MDFDIRIVWQHWPQLLEGFKWTILMVSGGLLIGIVLGALTCAGKMAGTGPLKWLCVSYINLFRTLPEMVTIFWVYYCLPLLLDVSFSSTISGLISLALFAGAFLAEIFRAAILSVPKGQWEAAASLGVPDRWIWIRVILPQGLRTMGGPFIAFLTDLVKVSGLLSAINVAELVYQASIIGGATFRYIEVFTAVGILYLLIISPLSLLSQRLEERRLLRER